MSNVAIEENTASSFVLQPQIDLNEATPEKLNIHNKKHTAVHLEGNKMMTPCKRASCGNHIGANHGKALPRDNTNPGLKKDRQPTDHKEHIRATPVARESSYHYLHYQQLNLLFTFIRTLYNVLRVSIT